MAAAPAPIEGEPEKKKRRQNVACDSCKLRRIKCDLLGLLTAQSSSSSSTGAQPPLHVLAAQHPDIQCSNCISKGLRCTTQQITNPSRPNKGGKRIQEARMIFGDGVVDQADAGSAREQGSNGLRDGVQDDSTLNPMSLGAASATENQVYPGIIDNPALDSFLGSNLSFNLDDLQTQSLANISYSTDTGHPCMPNPTPFLFGAASIPPAPALAALVATTEAPATTAPHNDMAQATLSEIDLDWLQQFDAGPTPASDQLKDACLLPSTESFNPLSAGSHSPTGQAPQPSRAIDIRTADAGESDHLRSLFSPPIPPSQRQAHELWRAIVNSEEPGAEARTAAGVDQRYSHLVSPASEQDSVAISDTARGSHDSAAAITPASGILVVTHPDAVFDPSSSRFIKRTVTSDNRPIQHESPATRIYQDASALYPSRETTPRPSLGPQTAPALVTRKRPRLEDDGHRRMFDLFQPHDTWHLWAEDDATLRWSRLEEVGERLADRTLGAALSRHLVKVYFQAVHLSLPAISPETFYLEWRRAGERSDRMTPAQEVLCAVLEAFAARYSDSPVVLGLDPKKAIDAPKVIQSNGVARAHWGRARENVCHALLLRARKLMDLHGVLRKPSVTGVQALTVYSHLLHMTSMRMDATEYAMETRLVHAAMVEQMDQLELMWQSTGWIPVDQNELPVSVGQMRMKQRRLFWTMILSDAFWAAGAGQPPKVPEEELDASRAWLNSVESKLPASTFKALAYFMSSYHRMASVGRQVARKLTVPARRPGTIDVEEFCTVVEHVWRETREIYRDISARGEKLLAACDSDLLGFSPVNYISIARSSCPILLLITHQAIQDQLDFRKSFQAAHIEASNDGSPRTSDVALLENLYKRSVEVLLEMCRSQVFMFEVLLPTGIMQSAVFMRNLIATSQFLAEVPTNEQGYPDATPGGTGWTWAAKQKEVNICIDALYQLGWAWGDIAAVLDDVMLAMERMQPSSEEIERYAATCAADTTARHAAASRKEQEMDLDQRLYAKALSFWPPTSVPELVDKWAAAGHLAISPGSPDDNAAGITPPAVKRGGPFAALPNNLAQLDAGPDQTHGVRPGFDRMLELAAAQNAQRATPVPSSSGHSSTLFACLSTTQQAPDLLAEPWRAFIAETPANDALTAQGLYPDWDPMGVLQSALSGSPGPSTMVPAGIGGQGASGWSGQAAGGLGLAGQQAGHANGAPEKVFDPAGFWLLGTDDRAAAAAQFLSLGQDVAGLTGGARAGTGVRGGQVPEGEQSVEGLGEVERFLAAATRAP